ncbi:uncharacterized protein LOC134234651 [Saccostrea cucullata]|uniref:uncharacterized protein LOC134234651 n=1 Tax=Saccostrea cuccullata TaxID=36930 RepID=UPI002ED373D3
MVVTTGKLFCRPTTFTLGLVARDFRSLVGSLKMAENTVHANVRDISDVVLPLQLEIKGKNFKFLVRGKDLKYLSDHVDEVKEELTGLIPLDEVPDDPIYFTFINGNVHIPEVVLRKFKEHKSKDEDQNNNMDVTAVQEDNDGELENYCETGADNVESDSEGECKSRFEWKLSTTKKLLATLKDKKKKQESFSKNAWKKVAESMSGGGKKSPSPDQCREKFYSMRRAYRKYLTEKKKTGNGRPKPFLLEMEMHDILHDDPAFNPPIVKSSLGTEETSSTIVLGGEDTSSDSCCSSENEKKAQKKKGNELVEYLKDRDEKFLNAFQNMQEKTNKLMEKLIEKL